MKRRSLAESRPDLAAEWHPAKNGALTPAGVSAGSNKVVWWRCAQGHEWTAPVVIRQRKGCPYCAGVRLTPEKSLAARHPELAAQWHPTRNGTLTPAYVLPAVNYKVWWRCEHSHEWKTSPNMRTTRGTGCPYCNGMKGVFEQSLAAIFPAIAAEWHPTLNRFYQPGEVAPHSNRRVWWLCPQGHAYPSTIRNKVKGAGCPVCATD